MTLPSTSAASLVKVKEEEIEEEAFLVVVKIVSKVVESPLHSVKASPSHASARPSSPTTLEQFSHPFILRGMIWDDESAIFI